MADIDVSQQSDIGAIASNSFGEHYLFAINRNLFQGTDASTVFRSYYGEYLFEEDAFYIIVGTDSGLLYQYIKSQGVPKGSRYLFLETPEVLALLEDMDDPNGDIVVSTGEDWLAQADEMKIQKYAYMGRLGLRRSLGVVHGHYSGYPPFWREIKAVFDGYLKNVLVLLNVRPFINCQIVNLAENQIPATCLIDSFKGKTAALLAGGPSLDELLPWVRQNRENLLVIAVSRISHSLLEANIQPDIVASVDPLEFNLNVCIDMLEFQKGTLLVNNYHLSPNLLASWGGPKVFTGLRYPWETPLQPECLGEAVGTTVTNTALDIAVKAGVSQIILGGADFCFDQKGYTHAIGTAEHKMGSMPRLCDQQVKTNDGKMADSVNAYVDSGKTIDLQAQVAAKQGCRVINPAPGAMRLQNVEHLSLDEIHIEPLDKPARETLINVVPLTDKNTRNKIYNEELGEVDRVMKELKTIKKLARKGMSYNSQVRSKKGVSGEAHNQKIDSVNANKVNRIEEQLSKNYTATVELIKVYNLIRLTSILRLELGELDDDIQNNKIYFKALIDTSNDLLELLRSARARILSRLEEEKPQPNIQRMLDQWRKDKQPGRAILWGQQHETQVNQLSSEQQQVLRTYQDSFDGTVEKLGKDYIEAIEKDTDLDGTAGRAREYFLCQDENGLLRTLASLETHKDQKQAKQFIPLLQGYYAELNNKRAAAIDAYQKIIEGPVYLDALMRLFAIYSTTENWNSALETLKSLSEVSTTYSSMYADLLYSNGDIDTAVETYTEYLLNNPDDLVAMMKLGKIFQQCKSSEGVEWTMSYILGKDPNNHTAQKILDDMRQNKVTE